MTASLTPTELVQHHRFFPERAQETTGDVLRPSRCCARCRRGTAALLGSCGYDGVCKCHAPQDLTQLGAVLDRMETR
jgi:hypothetical protein